MNEEQVANQLKIFDRKIKRSFAKIKEDIFEHHKKLNSIRAYMNEWYPKIETGWKEEEKLREKFKEDSEEFTQKISQLKIALSSVKSLKNELVVMRDLARIEDKIKTSFKNDIDGYKEQVRHLKEILKEDQKRIKSLEKEMEKKPTERVIVKEKFVKIKDSKKKRVNGRRWSLLTNFDSFK